MGDDQSFLGQIEQSFEFDRFLVLIELVHLNKLVDKRAHLAQWFLVLKPQDVPAPFNKLNTVLGVAQSVMGYFVQVLR